MLYCTVYTTVYIICAAPENTPTCTYTFSIEARSLKKSKKVHNIGGSHILKFSKENYNYIIIHYYTRGVGGLQPKTVLQESGRRG